MKIAVIGTGSIGKRHLQTLSNLSSSEKIEEIRCFDQNYQRVEDVLNDIENVIP